MDLSFGANHLRVRLRNADDLVRLEDAPDRLRHLLDEDGGWL